MTEDENESNPSSPGWDAIDRALAPRYAGVEPKHFGTLVSHRLGGPDPLEGISAYLRSDPVPHWHFVTYGFTELFGKEWDDHEVNGFGFELTLRLTRKLDETEPPAWVAHFLQNLARYVFRSGNEFASGHHLHCNGPIALAEQTALVAVLFTTDPELGEFTCELGRARFLQVVGITEDELHAAQSWNVVGLLSLLRERGPLLCTDLGRPSILQDPITAARVQQGVREDGSSTGRQFLDRLECVVTKPFFRPHRAELVVGALQATTMGPVLQGRLLHDRELTLLRGATAVRLIPASFCRVTPTKDGADLHFTPDAAAELISLLHLHAGIHPMRQFPELTLRIEQTPKRDQDGNVSKTVG